MKLVFPEITFSAAHYLPGHPKCGCIHGHTYFVRNLTIETFDSSDLNLKNGMLIDFGVIKDYFKKDWDHRFIIPATQEPFVLDALELLQLQNNLKVIRGPPTAEIMAAIIWNELVALFVLFRPDLKCEITFELYEGPNQGVAYP